jgi:predicted peptidase
MRMRLPVLLLMASILTACSAAQPRPDRGGFVERAVTIDGRRHRYQVFVPAAGTARGKAPVVVFLHGSGERGDDNRSQVAVGLGPHLRRHADSFPAIVVFPQAPADSEWNQLVEVVFAQLDAATLEFDGDPDRTSLTGLSMGGYGVWELALRQPGRFAALVPVCGGLLHPRRPSMAVTGLEDAADPHAIVAQRLREVPVWLFHGARDESVPVEYSRRLAAALQAAGARDARYTEFPDADHNSWDAAYATPELWTWLFAQRRPQARDQP